MANDENSSIFFNIHFGKFYAKEVLLKNIKSRVNLNEVALLRVRFVCCFLC